MVELGSEPWSIRFYLDGGDGGVFAAHLVVRGAYIPGTVRCTGEKTIVVPPHIGGWSQTNPNGLIQINCYVDVQVHAYIIGSGPPSLTVLAETIPFWMNAASELVEEFRTSIESVLGEGGYHQRLTVPEGGIAGREAVLFIGPAINISTEVWEVVEEWDVQRRQDNTVVAVHPDIDFWKHKVDDYNQYRSILEMELPAFTQAATTSHQARVSEYGGRAGADPDFPMLVSDVNRLRDYYVAVGAYSATSTFTPVLATARVHPGADQPDGYDYRRGKGRPVVVGRDRGLRL